MSNQFDYTLTAVTAARLREVFHYDPNTGVFTRNICHNAKHVGRVNGARHQSGYLKFRVDGHRYYAHRLAWLYSYGVWPSGEIDHINGVKDDNRIVNLREATHAQNCENRRSRSEKTTSRYTGVHWSKDRQLWATSLCVGGRVIRLGCFESEEAAYEAYLAAKSKHHQFWASNTTSALPFAKFFQARAA